MRTRHKSFATPHLGQPTSRTGVVRRGVKYTQLQDYTGDLCAVGSGGTWILNKPVEYDDMCSNAGIYNTANAHGRWRTAISLHE